MNNSQAALATLVAQGHQFHRDERFDKAAACFTAAIEAFDALTASPGAAPRLLARCELVAAHAAVLSDLGRWADAEPPLRGALQALEGSAEAACDDGRAVLALLSFERGRCLMVRRDLPAAQSLMRAALTHLQGLDADLLRGRVLGFLGSALAMANDHEAGLPLLEQALAMLDRPLHRAQLRELVYVISNLGAVNSHLGQLDAAFDYFMQAEAMLLGLVSAGRQSLRVELARARMNLGATLSRAERSDESERVLQAALVDYDLAIRRSPPGADTFRTRALRAAALMNLGYEAFRGDRFDEAQRYFQRTSHTYAGLVAAHPELRHDQAKTWVNQAHLAARTGRRARAAALYAKGLANIVQLTAEGNTHLAPDHANAALGLARVEMAAGRVERSCALFEQALGTLVALTQRGQLRHAPAWLAGWQAQMSAVLAEAEARRRPANAAALATLSHVLADPPRRGMVGGDDAPQALLAGVVLVGQWLPATPGAAPSDERVPLVGQYLRHLLGWVADVLSESEPAWLHRHAETLQQVVEGLRGAACALPDASLWLAEWFFHTRGLRAQRSALAQGTEPRLVALRELLAQLRQLEDELLGANRAVPPAAGGDMRSTGTPGLLPPGPPPLHAEQQAAAWRELHDRVQALRDAAVADGLLPAALRVAARDVALQMAPNAALLMLARCADQRLLVVVLRGGGAPMTAASHAFITPHSDLEPFTVSGLNLLARRALAQRAGGRMLRSTAVGEQPATTTPAVDDADRFALALYRTLWDDAVAPALAALAAEGVDDICLLPSDELHLLPWSHFAATDARFDGRLAVYPSAGAWLRCRLRDAEPAATAPPRWAIACWPALDSPQPLPWVEIERQLSQRLWHGLSARFEWLQAPRPSADGVDALLGMGHGAAPGDNPACAGLALGDGAVLSAHDLLRVRTCRRALLSACVLGRTDEVFGEALGFLSGCFDYQTTFGTGWLTEVPDAEACLLSLALQHALRDAGPAFWGEVFRQTRQAIGRGEWPANFGGWLARELPAAVAGLGAPWRDVPAVSVDTTVFAVPPPSLQRLMPWAVALGQ